MRYRRQPRTPSATATGDFLRDLHVFRRQVAEATQFYYAGEAINEFAKRDAATLRALNRTPGFWVTATAALQFAAFVSVGRVFDSDPSAKTVSTLLSCAERDLSVFSKDAIERRKVLAGLRGRPLRDYMSGVYVPTARDFVRLRRLVRTHRKTYESQFAEIRKRHLAHTDVADDGEIAALFSRTKRRDFEQMLRFLNQLHDTLWELYYNGRRPVLRPQPFSCASIARRVSRDRGQTDQEHIVHDTMMLMRVLARASERLSPSAASQMPAAQTSRTLSHRSV